MDRTIVGIDVGTTKVCTVVAEVDDEDRLHVVGVGVVPARGLRKGVIVNVHEAMASVAESIEIAERISGYQIERAHVGVSGGHVTSLNSRGVVAIGRGGHGVTYDDIERAMEAAGAVPIPHNRQVIHVIPRGYIVDGQDGIRDPVGMHGFRLEVEAHIITGSGTALQNLVKCVENLGVSVDELALDPLASGQAVLTESEQEMGVVLADIGGGTTDIAIFIEGTVWHTVVLEVGGNHLTNDLAIGLRLPFESAEEIKLQQGHAQPASVRAEESFAVASFGGEARQQVFRREVANILEARVEEIFGLILREIKRSGYDGLLPAGVVLCGGSAQLTGIAELGRKVLGMPLRIGQPHNLLGLVDQLASPAFATSVGLLQLGMTGSLSLSLGRRRRRPSIGRRFGDWLRNFLPG
jgi:cell division protein FtsA